MSEAENRNGDWTDPEAAAARDRLALTRVLIWAEREAASMGRPEVAAALQEAIARLHSRS